MLDWFAKRWNEFLDILFSLVLSIFDMLKDLACFLFEGILSIVTTALSSIGSALSTLDIVQYFSMLPEDVQNVMAIVGVNDASIIIVTAIGIRLVLQLIPFTRLGS